MNDRDAHLIFDRTELSAAYGPGTQYSYVVKENQVFSLVQEVPDYWDGNTKMYYCSQISDSLKENIKNSIQQKSDAKPPFIADAIVPFCIIVYSQNTLVQLLTFTKQNDKMRDYFYELRKEIITDKNLTSSIPSYVLNNKDIARRLFIPQEYFKDK